MAPNDFQCFIGGQPGPCVLEPVPHRFFRQAFQLLQLPHSRAELSDLTHCMWRSRARNHVHILVYLGVNCQNDCNIIRGVIVVELSLIGRTRVQYISLVFITPIIQVKVLKKKKKNAMLPTENTRSSWTVLHLHTGRSCLSIQTSCGGDIGVTCFSCATNACTIIHRTQYCH